MRQTHNNTQHTALLDTMACAKLHWPMHVNEHVRHALSLRRLHTSTLTHEKTYFAYGMIACENWHNINCQLAWFKFDAIWFYGLFDENKMLFYSRTLRGHERRNRPYGSTMGPQWSTRTPHGLHMAVWMGPQRGQGSTIKQDATH